MFLFDSAEAAEHLDGNLNSGSFPVVLSVCTTRHVLQITLTETCLFLCLSLNANFIFNISIFAYLFVHHEVLHCFDFHSGTGDLAASSTSDSFSHLQNVTALSLVTSLQPTLTQRPFKTGDTPPQISSTPKMAVACTYPTPTARKPIVCF